MDASTALWSFALVVGLLTVTPGLDTALILRTAALRGRPEAWGVVAGIQAGTLSWGTLSSLGVSALLTASQTAYDALRLAGAAYLLWMGGRMLLGSLRRDKDGNGGVDAHPDVAEERDGPGGVLLGFRRGLLTNLLNPKIGVFYVAVLPQFIPAGASHLAMGVGAAGGVRRGAQGLAPPPGGPAGAGPGDRCGRGRLRAAAGAGRLSRTVNEG